MKHYFIIFYHDPGTSGGGVFTEAQAKEVKTAVQELQKALSEKEVDPLRKDIEEMKKAAELNQSAVDGLLIKIKNLTGKGIDRPCISFGTAFKEEIQTQFESKRSEFESFQTKRNATVRMELKTVGDMTLGNLTGDQVASYSTRQGIVPFQRTNARDIIPFVQSPTGLYVSYRETGGEGGIAIQTEGSAKSQIDYDLTEVKTVQKFIAGYARFSKQLMLNLPFLQNTLPRMLLRDFYKQENKRFWDVVATGATGAGSASVETDDVKQLLDALAFRADADFNNSVILCKNTQVGRLLKLLYTNGYYQGSGSVVGTPDGNIRIWGTPVIGCSFAQSADKVMILDSDYIERVETAALAVEFSYEDSNNFTENKVTARIECFEEFNLLRTDAHSYVDMGNSASS